MWWLRTVFCVNTYWKFVKHRHHWLNPLNWESARFFRQRNFPAPHSLYKIAWTIKSVENCRLEEHLNIHFRFVWCHSKISRKWIFHHVTLAFVEKELQCSKRKLEWKWMESRTWSAITIKRYDEVYWMNTFKLLFLHSSGFEIFFISRGTISNHRLHRQLTAFPLIN